MRQRCVWPVLVLAPCLLLAGSHLVDLRGRETDAVLNHLSMTVYPGRLSPSLANVRAQIVSVEQALRNQELTDPRVQHRLYRLGRLAVRAQVPDVAIRVSQRLIGTAESVDPLLLGWAHLIRAMAQVQLHRAGESQDVAAIELDFATAEELFCEHGGSAALYELYRSWRDWLLDQPDQERTIDLLARAVDVVAARAETPASGPSTLERLLSDTLSVAHARRNTLLFTRALEWFARLRDPYRPPSFYLDDLLMDSVNRDWTIRQVDRWLLTTAPDDWLPKLRLTRACVERDRKRAYAMLQEVYRQHRDDLERLDRLVQRELAQREVEYPWRMTENLLWWLAHHAISLGLYEQAMHWLELWADEGSTRQAEGFQNLRCRAITGWTRRTMRELLYGPARGQHPDLVPYWQALHQASTVLSSTACQAVPVRELIGASRGAVRPRDPIDPNCPPVRVAQRSDGFVLSLADLNGDGMLSVEDLLLARNTLLP